jgi:hypothetical protein
MTKNWWFKFDFRVWRTDSKLRRCSLETRAFWLEVLCIMHETDTFCLTGSYKEIARLVGCETEEVARCCIELQRTETADVTLGNGDVTLVSRRLKRDLSDREQTRLRVQRHRGNADVTAQSKSNKKEVKNKEEEKSKKTASPSTHKQFNDPTWTDAGKGLNLGYPFTDLFIAFPDLVLTPAHVGLIENDVKDNTLDHAALKATIALYLGNRDPSKPQSYNPKRVGTLLDVFKKKREELKTTNGQASYTKVNGQPTARQQIMAEQEQERARIEAELAK